MNWRAWLKAKWLRRVLAGTVTLLILAALGFWFLPAFVVGEAESPKVDAIYLAAFDPRLNNDEYAVALYRQGVAQKIVCMGNAITCDIFPADYARQHLLALGVPESDVLILRTPDTDCRAQLFQPTVKFAQEHGWRRITWIVDPAGSRQMRSVLQPKFKAAGIEMFVTFPPAAKAELNDGWWRSHWKMQRMMRDPLETTLDLFFAECR